MRTSRAIALLAFLTIIAIVGVVVGAVMLSISNTATVVTGPSVAAVGPETSTTTCSASTGSYSGSVTFNWQSVTQGTTVKQYACLENTGGSSYTVAFTDTLPASDGTISSPQSGLPIPSNGFQLVEFDWAISATAPAGPVSFTIAFS